MESPRKTLAANLTRWREHRGLSQPQLAKKTGLTLQTINKLEKQRRWVSDTVLIKLADALDLPSPAMLFNAAFPMPRPTPARETTPKEALKVLSEFLNSARVLSAREVEILAAFAALNDAEAMDDILELARARASAPLAASDVVRESKKTRK